MNTERRKIIDKGHLYLLGDSSKYYCTYAKMDKICQVFVDVNDNGSIFVYGVHDHDPLFGNVQERINQLVEELRHEAVKNFFDPFDLIGQQVFNRYLDVCHFLPKETALYHMKDARRDLHEELRSFEAVQNFLSRYNVSWEHHYINCESGDSVMVFTTPEMFRRLEHSTEIFINLIAKNIPKQPKTEEMLVFSILQANVKIPALFVLSTKRGSSDVYSYLWRRLIVLASQLLENLRIVSGEVTSSMATAILNNLPRVQIKYAVHLYIQDVFRFWDMQFLHKLPQTLLKHICGLVFLPSTRWHDAIDSVSIQFAQYAGTLPNLLQHINHYWLPRRNMICYRSLVYGEEITTLDETSTNIYFFIEYVVQEMIKEEKEWMERATSLVGPVLELLPLTALRIRLLQGECTIRQFMKNVFNVNTRQLIHKHLLRTDMTFTDRDLWLVTVNQDNPTVLLINSETNAATAALPDDILLPHLNMRAVEANPAAAAANQTVQNAEDQVPGAVNNQTQNSDINIYERIDATNFENDELVEGNARPCVVCLGNLPKVMVLPCLHLCLCFQCNFGRQLEDANRLNVDPNYVATCPVCRGNIEGTREVFAA